MTCRTLTAMVMVVALGGGAQAADAAPDARGQYTAALTRERALRSADRPPTLAQVRAVIAAYQRVVRSDPRSGYSDNALWQAGNLSMLAYERFGQSTDKRRGLQLLRQLKSEYPSSSLLERYDETLAAFERSRFSEPPVRAAAPPAARPSRPEPAVGTASRPAAPARLPASAGPTARPPISRVGVDPDSPVAATGNLVTIRAVTRSLLPDGVRVAIEMDGESRYHQERLTGPDRLFFDFSATAAVPVLEDATLKYAGTPVPEIRLGRHPDNTTRVVLELDGVESYSVFPLYHPYRLVVDVRRTGAPAPAVAGLGARPDGISLASAPMAPPVAVTPAVVPPPPDAAATDKAAASPPLPSRDLARPAPPVPSVPITNSNGQFSIARQLGLGISRVVIDAGHGGHDPGARGNGVEEAEVVLDVALRLRTLLQNEPGVEVVMTRENDTFIPLEERTAIANREGADLFVSIHANASRTNTARGVETYFLNFASNPQAEEVAARENSASARSMHSLPDIVRAIALNNKIDESRDFAETVQRSMVRKLKPRNTQLLDRGVKQAPFVVLIGAGMPSIIAEIAFVTHKQEGQLLKGAAYRQTIAEALLDAVVEYQKSLKVRNAIAAR